MNKTIIMNAKLLQVEFDKIKTFLCNTIVANSLHCVNALNTHCQCFLGVWIGKNLGETELEILSKICSNAILLNSLILWFG